MLKIIHILTLLKKLMIKILNFKLVIMLEYQNKKNIFAKGYTTNWSREVFVISKINHGRWTYVINDLSHEHIRTMEDFMKKNRKKTNQKEFRMEQVVKKKGSKVYVKWYGYDNLFNS